MKTVLIWTFVPPEWVLFLLSVRLLEGCSVVTVWVHLSPWSLRDISAVGIGVSSVSKALTESLLFSLEKGRHHSTFQYLKELQESWRVCAVMGQGGMAWSWNGEVKIRKREVLYCEGGEALEQRSGFSPMSGSVQGQLGWGPQQPGVKEGVPGQGWGLEWDEFQDTTEWFGLESMILYIHLHVNIE